MPQKPQLWCAECGAVMHKSVGSLPQGQARCFACRRKAPTYREVGKAKFACPKCGGPKWSGGDRPCRKCDGSVPCRKQCEVCGIGFRAKMKAQRTCSRICGDTLKFGIPLAERIAARPAPRPKATAIRYVDCAGCGRLFVTRASINARNCSRVCANASIAGLRVAKDRTVCCARCSTDFTAQVVTQPRRYCEDCAVQVLREARQQSKDRRRARRTAAFVAPVYRKKIYDRDGWRCKLCGKVIKRDAVVPHPLAPTLDHIVPLACGGKHEPANVQCAHFRCNSLKGVRGGGEQLLLIG